MLTGLLKNFSESIFLTLSLNFFYVLLSLSIKMYLLIKECYAF